MNNTYMLITNQANVTTVVSLSKRTGEMKSSIPMDARMIELLTFCPDMMTAIDCQNDFDAHGLGKRDIIAQW